MNGPDKYIKTLEYVCIYLYVNLYIVICVYVCVQFYAYIYIYIYSLHCNCIMHKKTATKEFRNTNFLK